MRQTPNEVSRHIGDPREEVPDEGDTRQDEARHFSSEDAYANRDTPLEQWVGDAFGGEHLCGPGFRPKTADCPEFALVIKELSLPANVKDQYNRNRALLMAAPRPWTT